MTNDVYLPDWSSFTPSSEDYENQKRYGLDYARVELSYKDLKDQTIEYIKNFRSLESDTYFSLMPDTAFSIVGKYCWCLNNGAVFAEDTIEFFNSRLDELLTKTNKMNSEAEKIQPAISFSINVSRKLFNDFDDLILEDKLSESGSEAYNLLVMHKPKLKEINALIKEIKLMIKHLGSFNQDEKEEAFSDEWFNKVLASWKIMLISTKNYKTNSKTNKHNETPLLNFGAAGKAKKATKDTKFKEASDSLQLKGHKPASIIGSNAAVIYNTKTRKLAIFYADGNEGFEIRGTTIFNVDAEKSFQKILREPEKQMLSITGADLHRIEIILTKNITSKPQPVITRLNENTIIINHW